MEVLLETKNIPALLFSIVVLLCAYLIKGVIEFVWKVRAKEDAVKDQTMKDILSGLKETNHSINNAFAAIKFLAGDKWPEIRAAIKDRNDEFFRARN